MSDQTVQGKPRRLRICNKSFPRERGYVEFPDIRLCGKWLHDSGYRAGDYIHVEHSPERIVITRRPAPAPVLR